MGLGKEVEMCRFESEATFWRTLEFIRIFFCSKNFDLFLIDDEEWEDMSDNDEDEVEGEMEVDERLEDISVAECVIDGKNQREIPLTECFFSGHCSKTIDDNLKYMEENFGFFIPM